ncbi:hypothetical protein BB561_006281 [Smittium simulii]|uniref:Uncharacterized protein n=1 Tax=Smittium simulii TaxID=133385 RepID=A0A2T9Y5D6_9FUNG|nr:hypothetical protein BB561_006281 [Smittium simulii]
MTALLSAVAAQVTITNPTDSRIINEIREDYDDFIRAANAAIADLMTKNNVATEAAKNALTGQTTVPATYNESTIKALLTAAPQILQYPAVWDVIDRNPTVITNPTDSRILKEISDDYDDFARAANAAIVDLMKKNNAAAEAAKKALSGKTTVPATYNEATIKALLTAAPQILQYPAVWDLTCTSNGSNNNNSNNIKGNPTVITNPTDSRILKEISDDYDDFARAANAAIVDLMKKNNAAAEAAKKALSGKTTVPATYNEATIKALLTAAPQILQYPAVWDVIDSNNANETLDADDLVFSMPSSSSSGGNNASKKSGSSAIKFSMFYGLSIVGISALSGLNSLI